LCNELIEQKYALTNETVLNHLYLTFKHREQWSKIEQMYSKAWSLLGEKHEGIGEMVFFSNVRLQQFLQQQQVAMKLYKNFQKKKYLYWYCASAALQEENPQMLTLAVKMLEKGIETDKNAKKPECKMLQI
jgi:hypothetical protein